MGAFIFKQTNSPAFILAGLEPLWKSWLWEEEPKSSILRVKLEKPIQFFIPSTFHFSTVKKINGFLSGQPFRRTENHLFFLSFKTKIYWHNNIHYNLFVFIIKLRENFYFSYFFSLQIYIQVCILWLST